MPRLFTPLIRDLAGGLTLLAATFVLAAHMAESARGHSASYCNSYPNQDRHGNPPHPFRIAA